MYRVFQKFCNILYFANILIEKYHMILTFSSADTEFNSLQTHTKLDQKR